MVDEKKENVTEDDNNLTVSNLAGSDMSTDRFLGETSTFVSRREFSNKTWKIVFTIGAVVASLIVFIIIAYMFERSTHLLYEFQGDEYDKINLVNLIAGTHWEPDELDFGSLNLLIGSLIVTFFAIIIVVPVGILVGVFLAEIVNPKVKNVIKPAIELISALPSVVLGLLGMRYLSRFTQFIFQTNSGFVAMTGSIALAFMTIPFIASLTDDALSSVPQDLKRSALALGSSKWEVIRKISIPYSSSSIISACILAFGRIIGETMVVAMVTGNTWSLKGGLFNPLQGVYPIPGAIAKEYGDVFEGTAEYFALYFIGFELLIIAFLVTQLGRSIASGRISLPSYRKIRFKKRFEVKDFWGHKKGVLPQVLWILASLFFIWNIIEEILRYSSISSFLIISVLSLIGLLSYVGFMFSDRLKRKTNSIPLLLAHVPAIVTFIQFVLYLTIDPLSLRWSWLFAFLSSIWLFYSASHFMNRLTEANGTSDTEIQSSMENRGLSPEKNVQMKFEQQNGEKVELKLNRVEQDTSNLSRNKAIWQAFFFNLTRFFAYITVAILLAVVVGVCIDGLNPEYFSFIDLYQRKRWFEVENGEIVGQHYGWLQPIVGSIVVVFASSLVGITLSTLAGIYLFFYVKPGNRFGEFIRNSIQNIASVPSVVVGLFGWGAFVLAFGWGHSLLSGAFTLSIMMIPIATSTVIKSLEQVPSLYRLNALALGSTKWEAIKGQTLRYAAPSMLTGYLFSISRVVGETAPIMLTVAVAKIATNIFPTQLTDEGVAMLPFTIWSLALHSTGEQSMYWAFSGAMILVFMSAIIYALGQLLRAKMKVRYE